MVMMAEGEVVLSQDANGDALEQNRQLVLSDGRELGLEHYHGLHLGQTDGRGCDDLNLDLGRADDHVIMSLEGPREDEGYVRENSGSSVDKKPECMGRGLAIRNHDLIIEENALVVAENHGLDYNLNLVVDQNQDMEIVQTDDVGMEHQQLLVNENPVIQARMVVASPNYELVVGQEFADVLSCRRALRDTAIALHFEIQTIKSDKTRFTAKCASEGCPWRIHAAKLPGVPTFNIRKIHGQHTCGGIAHLGNQQASVRWVASTVEQRLNENPNCKPKEILEEIHRAHGITLSYKQAWRGKEGIMAAVRGSFEEGYHLLPQYCEQLKRTNPGSMACVYGDPTDNSFPRLFLSFKASIYGFINACRPLIGLDRTNLNSKYHGTLLLPLDLMVMVLFSL